MTTDHGEAQQLLATATNRHHDTVRWSAIWAGLVAALAVFVLLEVAFFSLGWLNLAQGTVDTTAGLVSALVGLIAFFAGGLVAGGTSVWRGAREGLTHGLMVWALGVVGIIFLTLFGGGALFGPLAAVLSQASSLQQQAANVPPEQLEQVLDSARGAGGWAVLGMLLSLVAAAVGGLLGGRKGWRRQDGPPVG